MNVQTILLLGIAGLVFGDAILTYITYKKTGDELEEFREKCGKFDIDLGSLLSLYTCLDNQIGAHKKKFGDMRSELTNIHMKLAEVNRVENGKSKKNKGHNENKA